MSNISESATHAAVVRDGVLRGTYAVRKSGNRFGQLCNGRTSRIEALYEKHVVAANVKVAAAGRQGCWAHHLRYEGRRRVRLRVRSVAAARPRRAQRGERRVHVEGE